MDRAQLLLLAMRPPLERQAATTQGGSTVTGLLGRIVLAVVVAIVVGLVCMALLGPLLVAMHVPPAVVLGNFLVTYGWTLGILAGLWYFFSGTTWPRKA
jgi:site-specific recombinase